MTALRETAIALNTAAREAAAEGLARPDGSVLITVAARRAGVEKVGSFLKTRLNLSDDRMGIIPLSDRPGPPPRR